MKVAFLDFEASSLSSGSYPIEIGWAYPDLTGKSFLIRNTMWLDSASNWRWSTESAHVHGITQDELRTNGHSPEMVITALAELQDYIVCSDSPAFEQYWLHTLAIAAGLPAAPFKFADCDAIILTALEQHHQGLDRYLLIEQICRRETPVIHRALADATYWANMYRLATMDNDEFIAKYC